MSVNQRMEAGFGFQISEQRITEWAVRFGGNFKEDLEYYSADELLDTILDDYPKLTYIHGGGGWSSSVPQYAIVTRKSVLRLTDFDGVTDAAKLVPYGPSGQLLKARRASGCEDDTDFTVIIAGGFY